MNKEYKKYLESTEWAELRIDLFLERGFSCEKCNKKFKSQKGLEMHHKTYENIFNEEPEDLIILCSSCHRYEHRKPKNKIKDLPKLSKKQNKRRKRILLEMRTSANYQKKMMKYN